MLGPIEEHLGSQLPLLTVTLAVEALDLILVALIYFSEFVLKRRCMIQGCQKCRMYQQIFAC